MPSLFSGEVHLGHMVTIAALACVSVLARCLFFLSSRAWTLPGWAQRGLQYAPMAALSAVIAPEVVMSQGHLIHSLQDARLYGVVAAMAFFFVRRGVGQVVLGAIVCGMGVYLPLHIGLGW
jgi:branched-subunit amino acid transport protein